MISELKEYEFISIMSGIMGMNSFLFINLLCKILLNSDNSFLKDQCELKKFYKYIVTFFLVLLSINGYIAFHAVINM